MKNGFLTLAFAVLLLWLSVIQGAKLSKNDPDGGGGNVGEISFISKHNAFLNWFGGASKDLFQIIVESEKEEETDDDEATVEDAPDESEEVEIPEVKVNPQPAQPTRDAQSFETQDDCAKLCPQVFSPVCGTDGKTYSNECELSVADCKDKGRKIQVAKRGPCEQVVPVRPTVNIPSQPPPVRPFVQAPFQPQGQPQPTGQGSTVPAQQRQPHAANVPHQGQRPAIPQAPRKVAPQQQQQPPFPQAGGRPIFFPQPQRPNPVQTPAQDGTVRPTVVNQNGANVPHATSTGGQYSQLKQNLLWRPTPQNNQPQSGIHHFQVPSPQFGRPVFFGGHPNHVFGEDIEEDVVNPSLGEDDPEESAEDFNEDEELELNKPALPFRPSFGFPPRRPIFFGRPGHQPAPNSTTQAHFELNMGPPPPNMFFRRPRHQGTANHTSQVEGQFGFPMFPPRPPMFFRRPPPQMFRNNETAGEEERPVFFPRVGLCGSHLREHPGVCVPQSQECPTHEMFNTRAVGFCSNQAEALERQVGEDSGEAFKCCSTLPKGVLELPVAQAFPGLACRNQEGKIGKCHRFMKGCPDQETALATCGAFRNAQLCCTKN